MDIELPNKEKNMSEINPDQIRDDISNYGTKIFFNSAGSSLPPKSVNLAIKKYLDLEENLGGYQAAEHAIDEIEMFYEHAAQLLNCKPHNIAFTNNATDSYLKALFSFNFKKDDIIITTDDDYASNYIHFITLQKNFGIRVIRISNLENGDLDIANFERLIEENPPKLVSVSHIPTNSGLIQNTESIGKICTENEIPFLLDACQSAGQLNLDVNELSCDFLSITGRKFLRGPRGTGLLYVSDRMLDKGIIPQTIDGRGGIWNKSDDYDIIPGARRFEMWEKSYALQLGLAEAIRYANEIGLDRIADYNAQLMKKFRDNLNAIEGVKMYDRGSHQCNILTFRKDGKSLDTIKTKLEANNICFSVSEKEWGFIDFNKKGVDWVVRLSPHYFNTMEEIDQVSNAIESI